MNGAHPKKHTSKRFGSQSPNIFDTGDGGVAGHSPKNHSGFKGDSLNPKMVTAVFNLPNKNKNKKVKVKKIIKKS
jgi:hypothetical protein